uniref:Ion transport domain-containing protein n=1 Tax=Heterosigma akashiwo TaxID=2829 RepID=A0A7S3UV12_HETAK
MFDASQFWLPLETFFALVFTAELVTRLIVARNKLQFCLDTMNWCDVAAVVPFYVDVVDSLVSGTPLDFTLGPTKPALLMFIRMAKVFRVFKLTRHFQGAAVLVETFHLAWKKLLVPILFFFLFTLIFGGLVFAVESGTECFVGEGSCSMLGYEDEFMYSNGTRLLIDPYGELANINDMNGAIWLTIVTMTSVGYGLITPSYMPGKFVMVFVMLFGTFYLAMPLIGHLCRMTAFTRRKRRFGPLGGNFSQQRGLFLRKQVWRLRRVNKGLSMLLVSLHW